MARNRDSSSVKNTLDPPTTPSKRPNALLPKKTQVSPITKTLNFLGNKVSPKRVAIKRKHDTIEQPEPEHSRTPRTPTPIPANPLPIDERQTNELNIQSMELDGTASDEEESVDFGDVMYDGSSSNLDAYPSQLSAKQAIENIYSNLAEAASLMGSLQRDDAIQAIQNHQGILDQILVLSMHPLYNSLTTIANQQAQIIETLKNVTASISNMESRMNTEIPALANKVDNINKAIATAASSVPYSAMSFNNSETRPKASVATKANTVSVNLPLSNNNMTGNNQANPLVTTPMAEMPPNSSHHPSRLVVQFLPDGIKDADKSDPQEIVQIINDGLSQHPDARHLKVVAARFNKQGNLILSTRSDQTAAELIKHATKFLPAIDKGYQTEVREDKKWYKIQVDGVSTRTVGLMGQLNINSEERVHRELAACNPYYAQISAHITSIPRWMRTKEDLYTTPRSSVVFAVDNESVAKKILTGRTLAAFGRHCTLRAYQDRPPITQCKNCWKWDHKKEHCKEEARCRLCAKPHDPEEHKKEKCKACQEAYDQTGDEMDTEDNYICTHILRCANCIAEGREDNRHAADSRQCPIRINKYGTVRANDRKAQKADNPWTVVNNKKGRKKPKTQQPSDIAKSTIEPTPLSTIKTALASSGYATTSNNSYQPLEIMQYDPAEDYEVSQT
ncbi:hypothetical protein CVT26_001149 [Gymnopilus dilepis]|uniref:Gag-like protein n=1 Tax=Gymnopilus dilepis TaxID=231916 RepID=A0A409YLI4_9AGAR|nr:hypothetical protein CVT26_001149 [Gymnopilus dilepis]